ncbi:peptidase S8/S53 domain-containing protein, partial [Piptocephalis cylindrospora]
DAPWGLASLNTYKNESLPQDYQKNFTYLTRHDGKDVNVYVLDSGINPNSTEFGSRLSIGPNFSTDKVSDDLNGHGTSMASIIGSQTFGVANGVNITSIKIFNQWGDSTHSAAMEAFQWVWEDRVTTPSKYKRSLINLSAIFERGETFDEAINAYYLQKQIDTPTDNDGRNLLVLSAGNTGGDACNYSPAYEARTMVVTAHDQNKEIPSWANNGGNCTFYAAPGHRIISFNQRYELSSGYGTSQAAAFASGVLASLLS